MGFILYLVIIGLVAGALGRLAIPGPNPMSIPMTILVGIGGALLAGLVARLLFGSDNDGAPLIFAVAGSALIVWLMQRNRGGVTR